MDTYCPDYGIGHGIVLTDISPKDFPEIFRSESGHEVLAMRKIPNLDMAAALLRRFGL